MKQLKNMKETLVSATQAQLANLQNVDTKELGCAIDMIKDLSEAIYYCSIVKSMDEAQKEQASFKEMYSERDMDRDYNRMYYSEPGRNYNRSRSHDRSEPIYRNEDYQEFEYYPKKERERNPYEGKSYERRRTYMESKHNGDKSAGMKELEQYAQELTSDVVEMMQDATAEEKQMLARKLTVLANKVQQA